MLDLLLSWRSSGTVTAGAGMDLRVASVKLPDVDATALQLPDVERASVRMPDVDVAKEV